MNVFLELTGQDSFAGWSGRPTGWFNSDAKPLIMGQEVRRFDPEDGISILPDREDPAAGADSIAD